MLFIYKDEINFYLTYKRISALISWNISLFYFVIYFTFLTIYDFQIYMYFIDKEIIVFFTSISIKFNLFTCLTTKNYLFYFKTMNDFIYDSLDIIMEANKFNFNNDKKKLMFCTPYYYDDPIFKECTKIIKQIIEKEKSIDVSNKIEDFS